MSERPLIAIECDLETNARGRRYAKCYEKYFDAVVAAGGAPLLLAPVPDDVLAQLLSRVEGVVVPGGDDFAGEEWGEAQRPCPRFVASDSRRLEFGKRLIRAVLAAERPYLGVCYGAQLLNLACAGTLVQDIAQDLGGDPLGHHTTGHAVEVAPDSLLARLTGRTQLEVNSRHHQAIAAPGRDLVVSARAADGVVEAIEAEGAERFLLGVQWHPEDLEGPSGGALFSGLVEAARARR